MDQANPNHSLHLLTIQGLTGAARELLEAGFDVNEEDPEQRTSLEFACWKNDLEITALLFQHGASGTVCRNNIVHRSLLSDAISRGNTALVKLLLDSVPDLDVLDSDRGGMSEAAFKGHEETLHLLLDRGASVDARNVCGRKDEASYTTLAAAAMSYHFQTVRLLLDKGADINI
jgi:ankyrin repeat protein